MPAGDAPATMAELRTDFLEKLKDITGNTAMNDIALRFLNTALQDMHNEDWWWAERPAFLRTVAPYSTGTIDIAVTSLTTRRTVTGTSTAWNTTNSFDVANAVAGDKMRLGGSNDAHEITTVGSATSITLSTDTPYTGTSALDDASYEIYRDEYAPASGFQRPAPIDIRFFDEDRTIRLLGSHEFNRLSPRNTKPSKPLYATVIERGPSGSVSLRPRIVLGPPPDAARTYLYRFYTTDLAVSTTGTVAANLSDPTDQPIVPLAYRRAIVFKALENWYGSRQVNTALAAQWKGAYDELMLRARARTGQAEPRPRLQADVSSYWQHRARRGGVRWGATRYDGGTAFDQLRY